MSLCFNLFNNLLIAHLIKKKGRMIFDSKQICKYNEERGDSISINVTDDFMYTVKFVFIAFGPKICARVNVAK